MSLCSPPQAFLDSLETGAFCKAKRGIPSQNRGGDAGGCVWAEGVILSGGHRTELCTAPSFEVPVAGRECLKPFQKLGQAQGRGLIPCKEGGFQRHPCC